VEQDSESYQQALAVQRAHEQRLITLPGVTGVAVKLRDERLALVVDLDPEADVPEELRAADVDGLPLIIERNRYRPL